MGQHMSMINYPEWWDVLDHFQTLNNSSSIRNLPIPQIL